MSTLNFLINRSTLPLLACLLIWFALLGYRDLVDPDEGRYAEISREMVASGNWITPRLNGFKYFEKPPLQYWTTATIFTVFGENNTTARLWVAAIGFAGALWAGFVGTRLYGRNAGYYAFIITLSGLLYFGNAHYLTLDTTLTVFVVLALGSLVLAQHQRRQPATNRAWMLLGWAALAAAVLSKGLIGLVLPIGATVFYSLWQRDWNLWRHLHLIKGATLFLLLTVPWFIAVSTRNDEFAHFFFVREHLQRYTTPVHGHNGPIWYFPVVFLLATAPWLTTSIMSLVKPSFGWRPRPRSGEFNAERLLWVFVVFVLFFFSFSNSKLPPYILPALPIVAILAGRRIAATRSCLGDPWVLLGLGSILAAMGTVIPLSDNLQQYQPYRPWLLAAGVSMLVGSAALFAGKTRLKTAMTTAGLCSMLTFQFLLWGYQSIVYLRTAKPIANKILALDLSAQTPVYLVGTHAPSLPFYLRRLVTQVAYRGELAMGIDAEPYKNISLPSVFAQQWQEDKQAVAVLSNRDFEYFRQFGTPMTVLFQGPRKTLVEKPQNAAQNAIGKVDTRQKTARQ
ncbi:phospholipid carrier-dependent glycosyltransferase [Sedimenticola sp.]|uniref:glycosyltransferase family 39 protein n=1 Tax=Sedimenticola sp. TaxID=1940285 RepID=UPI003D10EB4E